MLTGAARPSPSKGKPTIGGAAHQQSGGEAGTGKQGVRRGDANDRCGR